MANPDREPVKIVRELGIDYDTYEPCFDCGNNTISCIYVRRQLTPIQVKVENHETMLGAHGDMIGQLLERIAFLEEFVTGIRNDG
jgi:hypothetical protein